MSASPTAGNLFFSDLLPSYLTFNCFFNLTFLPYIQLFFIFFSFKLLPIFCFVFFLGLAVANADSYAGP